MLHSSLLIRRLLNSIPTSFPSLANSLKEKKNTRWTSYKPIEDHPVDDNIWSLGKATPMLKTLGNPSSI